MNKKKDYSETKGKVKRTPKAGWTFQELGLSEMGLKIIFSSIGLLIVGFILLKFTNPAGNNWASFISPLLIILAYIFIGVGIMVK